MTGMIFRDARTWILLVAGMLVLAMVQRALPSDGPNAAATSLERVEFSIANEQEGSAQLVIRSMADGQVQYSEELEGPLTHMSTDKATLPIQGNARRTERLVSIPTSLKWRRPMPGQPSAMVVRAAPVDKYGVRGTERIHTIPLVDHGGLHVLSLVVPEGALFDPDSGIYVVGNAMLHDVHAEDIEYEDDPKWWKYPGNFHGRGKDWERSGTLQLLAPGGRELLQYPVDLRINGQLTRAFPQHALRILFDESLPDLIFEDDRPGIRAVILRTAGNDQVKAFMRDALLQSACAGSAAEVSRALSCVVYVNGAYWGVHHLRHRMDEREIARRHGIRAKEVVFVEENDGSLAGEWHYVKHLKELVVMAKAWNGTDPGFITTLGEQLDLDAFLEYMAIMLYVDNRDWPRTNTKFWRKGGEATSGHDALWRPVLQDLDLAFGAIAPPTADPWQHIRTSHSSMTTIFLALMRSPEWHARFQGIMLDLLDTRFAESRMVARIDSMEALLAPEMVRHAARWRKPAGIVRWKQEVDVLRDFAKQRPGVLRRMLSEQSTPLP
jgi:hypothetical protein